MIMETSSRLPLQKAPTGITGLDEITEGGLPKGRPTLVCGGAGCGKTLLGIEFLVHGAELYGDPGVFMSFEETPDELATNVVSLGLNLDKLQADHKLRVEYIHLDRGETVISGGFNLEGLFIWLGQAIEAIGAKRVVLDSLETLFISLPDQLTLRSEFSRLFIWLKEKGVTTVVTSERGNETLTRHGMEEYLSDCVIFLDHRVTDQVSTRRMQIVKYRGSFHGTNEYPFLIDTNGISVLPVTSLGLQYTASDERISTGIARLDAMLEGKGFFRGSTVLISGTAGSGKTSVAAHFVDAACRRGERALYISLEESPSQVMRNMRSIGLDLAQWLQPGLLIFQARRPTISGLEMHLAIIQHLIKHYQPTVVVVDPITGLLTGSAQGDVKAMLMRLVDFLKTSGVTALFTSLTGAGSAEEHTDTTISSVIDTWLLLRDMEMNGERNRTLYVLKSRGMAHSNQVREFVLTNHGVDLLDVYIGPSGVLTGSARLAQEAQEKAAVLLRDQALEQKKMDLERKRQTLAAQIAALQGEFQAEEAQTLREIEQHQARESRLALDQVDMAKSRQADANSSEGG